MGVRRRTTDDGRRAANKTRLIRLPLVARRPSPSSCSSLVTRHSSLHFSLAPFAFFLFTSQQSVLDPAGPQAARLSGLWWAFFYVLATVYVVVMVVLVAGVVRSRRRRAATEGVFLRREAGRERRIGRVVTGAVALTVLTLFALLTASFLTGRRVYSLSDPDPLEVRVIGRQWWWEVRYDGERPSEIVATANEIHVPVGRLVRFHLESRDVIHSFWVPNLHGKKDLVPNNPAETYLRADRPGEYWGQCAEFCGLQHAHMRLLVVAEPPEQFEAWLAAQKKPAPPPSTESQSRGQQIFLSGTCVMCHTVAGTPARGTVGPNLTHVASNKTIAAGSLANTRENLARWVTDSQSVKPGTRMPPHTLAPEDLEAVLDYLESLK